MPSLKGSATMSHSDGKILSVYCQSPYRCKHKQLLAVNKGTFAEANLQFLLFASLHNWGQLLRERICSSRSKFFLLRGDPILVKLRCPGNQTNGHKVVSLGKMVENNVLLRLTLKPLVTPSTQNSLCLCCVYTKVFMLLKLAGPSSAVGRAPDSYVRGPGFDTRSGHILSFLR